MNIIGRKKEKDILDQALRSDRPEFIVVYGRRRIGKTYLIKEYFNNRFSFYATGVPEARSNRLKLKAFYDALREYGDTGKKAPEDWIEAFGRLKKLLSDDRVIKDPVSGKMVIFLDELPWMDSNRSDFKTALDLFWNGWASTRSDICLIVCGSATSWIIKNLLLDRGGFYNRITRKIHLDQFTLLECEELFLQRGIILPRDQVVRSYMTFGGVPYYLNYYDSRLSLDQNIQELIFENSGQLFDEADMLFRALYIHPENHMKVIDALAGSDYGLNRTELSDKTGISNGISLTNTLLELEQCGFIRRYKAYRKEQYGSFYQITDPFTLFYSRIVRKRKVTSWMQFIGSPGYYGWLGSAFEKVCLNHVRQIKTILGISGIESSEYSWQAAGNDNKKGAQIDLLIDRADNMVNILEMKCTEKPFAPDKEYRSALANKRDRFTEITRTKKAVTIILISMNGVSSFDYAGIVHRTIAGEELFI